MTQKQKAIAVIKDCRHSHVWWAAKLKRNPKWGKQSEVRAKIGGSAAFHRRWVRNYDLVLEVLRS